MQWPERNLYMNQEVRLIEPEFKLKKKNKTKKFKQSNY